MRNITLAIDEELLGKARGLAERRRTSLNAMVRSLLAQEVEQEDRIAWAREGMRHLMETSTLVIDPDVNVKELSRRYVQDRSDELHGYEHPGLRGGGETQ
jgi:predicted transcriptional regulator